MKMDGTIVRISIFKENAMGHVQLSSSILEDRYSQCRTFLEEADLGALFAYSPAAEHKWGQTGHVSYLTGWANHDRIVDSAVVVPAKGAPALLIAGLPFMLDQVPDVSPIEDVRLVQAVDPNAVAVEKTIGSTNGSAIHTFAGATQVVLDENGLGDKRVGVVGIENMPVPFYESLVEKFGDRLLRAEDIIARLRSIKSTDEMKLMRHAAHLGDLGFDAMLSAATPGISGIEVVAEMEQRTGKPVVTANQATIWAAFSRLGITQLRHSLGSLLDSLATAPV